MCQGRYPRVETSERVPWKKPLSHLPPMTRPAPMSCGPCVPQFWQNSAEDEERERGGVKEREGVRSCLVRKREEKPPPHQTRTRTRTLKHLC